MKNFLFTMLDIVIALICYILYTPQLLKKYATRIFLRVWNWTPTETWPMKTCSKCESTNKIEQHHFHPRCHFKGSKATIDLCHDHHLKIETIILAVESFVGGVPFGTRYKLTTEQYNKIHRHWLRDAKIIRMHFV